MAPLAFLAVYAGGVWFQGLLALGAVVMAWEWETLCCKRFSWAGGVLAVGGVGVVALGAFHPIEALLLIIPILLGVWVGCRGRERRKDLVWLVVGTFYITLPVLALVWIRLGTDSGLNTVLWLFFAVWATDTGGYVCGRTIGGPKLMPRISPNKTWAGLIGGAVWAMMVGVLFALWNEHSIVGLLICSFILALVAQAGDLWESWVKRYFDAKDSGTIIPGHGGLFDRIDGLLSASLYVAVLCALREGNIYLW